MAIIWSKIKNYFKNTDYIMLGLALLLSGFGFILIYSATNSMETSKFVVVQAVGFLIGFAGMMILSFMDFNYYSKFSIFVYIASILFIIATFIFGKEVKGNLNWIQIGPISIQPSEFAKLGFILTFASHLAKCDDGINDIKNLILLGLHILPFIGIIAVQGDFGTVLVFVAIFIVMMFSAGLKWKYFLMGGAAGAVILPLLFFFYFENYQRMRILVAFKPELDPSGYGYQGLQSKVAIGAGGIDGQGFMQGLQTQYSILPEKQTDFIFSVAGEEFGFIGCIIILMAYICLFLRIIYVARRSVNNLGTYICMGVLGMLSFQAIENIGMCLTLLPVIGITLPFMSYGGSSIVSVWLSMGLIESVAVNSKRLISFSNNT